MGQEALDTALLGMGLMAAGLLLMLVVPSRQDRPMPMFPFVTFLVGLILLIVSTNPPQQQRHVPAPPPAKTTP